MSAILHIDVIRVHSSGAPVQVHVHFAHYCLCTLPDNLADVLRALDTAGLTQERIQLLQDTVWLDTSLHRGGGGGGGGGVSKCMYVCLRTRVRASCTVQTGHNTSDKLLEHTFVLKMWMTCDQHIWAPSILAKRTQAYWERVMELRGVDGPVCIRSTVASYLTIVCELPADIPRSVPRRHDHVL